MSTKYFDQLTDVEKEKIMLSVNTLCAGNHNVVAQLEKLAELKGTNSPLWQGAIKMLKL
jgi:hypothetical protein